MPTPSGSLLALALLLPLSQLGAHAYTFKFASTPRQCREIAFTIDESDGRPGKPPYRATLIPAGPTPLTIEARRIIDTQFNDTTSLKFQFRYPANSQFVTVVSDANGFGTGGASAIGSVLSGDDGCFSTTQEPPPAPWFLDLNPRNQLTQCTAGRIWWNPAATRGDVNFFGVIPGGNVFTVPKGLVTSQLGLGDGFNWTPPIRVGTTVILIGNDDHGIGSGGSSLQVIGQGPSLDNSCINDQSPSTTSGDPAGGSYPTSTSGAGIGGGANVGGGGGSSGPNIGAIVGGVVGGVVGAIALALLALFLLRRRKFHNTQKEKPVDLLQDGERDSRDGGARDELPQYYRPEPFMLPDPSAHGSERGGGAAAAAAGVAGSSAGRPSEESATTAPLDRVPPSAWALGVAGAGRSGGSDRSSSGTGTRKSAAGPTPLRPVNIVQHEDARRISAEVKSEEEAETIELPPAYTNIRRGPSTRVPPPSIGEEGPVAQQGQVGRMSAEGRLAEGSPLLSPPQPAPAAA